MRARRVEGGEVESGGRMVEGDEVEGGNLKSGRRMMEGDEEEGGTVELEGGLGEGLRRC